MRDGTAFNGVRLCQSVAPKRITTRPMPANALSSLSVVGLVVARWGFPASRWSSFSAFVCQASRTANSTRQKTRRPMLRRRMRPLIRVVELR